MVMQCFKYNQHFVAMMNIINLAKIQNVNGKFEKHKSKRTLEHCKKLSNSIKQKYNDPEFRRMNSERQKGHKWSNGSLGMHWYNNGIVNKCTYTCPEGFVKGRLKKWLIE